MSGFKRFAVVGAGNVGRFIVNEFLNLKASGTISSVAVVSRSDASAPEWTSKGAKFAIIDYDSPSTITDAFANVDVVISTVAGRAISKEAELAAAAKSVNVKLFIPSDFGTPVNTKAAFGNALHDRGGLLTELKELGLPYSVFYTGLFSDFAFVPPLGWDFANGKVSIGGGGNAPISFTSRPDIARYLGHVLTTLPSSELEWRAFAIEGDRLTFNEVVDGYQAKTGRKLEVTHTPQEVLKERLTQNPQDILSSLQLVFDLGEGISGKELDNDVWPEWNPKKVLDIIA